MIRLMQAVTPIHVGEGRSMGTVSLPIARERHTGLPFLPGSSLKGGLKAHCIRRGLAASEIVRLFGEEPDAKTPRRGELILGDGQLLALSVRCLQGSMALLTSPLLLGRLARNLAVHPPLPTPSVEVARAAEPEAFMLRGRELAALEDLELCVASEPIVRAWQSLLSRWIADQAPVERLLVVHDDVLAFATEAWLPLRTRTAIANDGVVDDHKLFTVESLPMDSLLFTEVEGPHEHLPGDGEAFVVGGQATVGAGRVAWYRGES